MSKQSLTLESLYDHVNNVILSPTALRNAFRSDLVDTSYKNAVEEVITLVMIALVEFEYINPGESMTQDDIQPPLVEITDLIAAAYEKPSADVERDISNGIKQFPLDDLKQSTKLRFADRLN